LWKICGKNNKESKVLPNFSIKTRVFKSGRGVIDFGIKWSENGDRWEIVENCGITAHFCGKP